MMSNSPVNRQLKELGESMFVGETKSGLECIWCRGGRNRERSMSASRESDKLLYKCHRASCSFNGSMLMSRTSFDNIPKANITRSPNPLSKYHINNVTFQDLSLDQKEFLRGKYKMVYTDFDWGKLKWSASHNRLWLPLRGMYGGDLGGTLRSFEKDVTPKAVIVRNSTNTVNGMQPYSFYSNRAPNREVFTKLLIVEDQLSAIKASRFIPTVALCGVNLSDALVQSMINSGRRNAIMCLDADAFNKSVELARKYSGILNSCKVYKPKCDVKNMSEEEFVTFQQDITNLAENN